MEGHIKLYRQFVDWEWYRDQNTKHLFIHMLLKANWKDGRFKGIEVKRGSFISSYPGLAAETGLTEDKVRTALGHLKSSGEITVSSQSKFSVFTIVNYSKYQDFSAQTPDNSQSNPTQTPDSSQPVPTQIPAIEERKNDNKLNKDIKNNDSASPPQKGDVEAFFENLWSLYPLKRGKGSVSIANKRRLLDIGLDEMTRAIDRYKADLAKEDWRKPQNGSTFFNSGYVDYLDDNYNAPPKQDTKPSGGKGNGFHNFSQRDTDLDAIMLQGLKGDS